MAQAIAIARTFGLDEDYFTRYRERVRSVTPDDVRRVACAHLHPEQVMVVAVGDASVIGPSLEHLQIGPVSIEEAAT